MAFATLVAAAALAQAPAPVATAAERLAFTIEFEDTRVNHQPVGATTGSAWTPMFPRVVPWQARPGEPAIDAIKYVFERAAEGVRFEVRVLLGKPHQQDVVVHEGTLRVGERVKVDGVLAYGARPVIVGLIPLATFPYHEPTPVSAAPGLIITGVEVVTEPAPRYLVTVENLRDRAVESLWVETRRGGRPAHAGSEGHEEGGSLIAPRERFTFDFPFPTGPPAGTGTWTPVPADVLTITAVVWDDGSFEGSARQAAVHHIRKLARRSQLERLVPLLDRARADTDIARAVVTLRQQIEALPIDGDEALHRSTLALLPPSGDLPAHEATALVRTFLQRVKTLASRALERVPGCRGASVPGCVPAARQALESLHTRFATWLSLLARHGAPNVNSVPVVGPHDGLAARSAATPIGLQGPPLPTGSSPRHGPRIAASTMPCRARAGVSRRRMLGRGSGGRCRRRRGGATTGARRGGNRALGVAGTTAGPAPLAGLVARAARLAC
jgi:hypothetical protein